MVVGRPAKDFKAREEATDRFCHTLNPCLPKDNAGSPDGEWGSEEKSSPFFCLASMLYVNAHPSPPSIPVMGE